MKKIYISIFTLLTAISGFSQEVEDKPKDGWTKTGNFSILFNQAAFNHEWTGGGTSNIAGNISLNYDANYRKGKLTWDNRFMGDYGLTKIKGDDFERKTNDRLEINSVIGYQIKESNWAYSFFVNFRTQFAKGYVFDESTSPVTRTETTRFMSPGYLQFGPGLLWKKSDNLKVNIAPATSRLIFVNSRFTDVGNDPIAIEAFNENPYFGVEANETLRFEFGASVSGYAKFDVVENVTMENILNLYSNYLEDPQNIDIDYTMNLVLKVNDYLSANVIFQAIYDDNAVKGFQIREVLGIGLNYKL
ncbi:DUF3078 domain-containing protein [uncultured Planktosalinus sp.]|mgnify:CR=1 FL=1|uniref:DUF3078 domain-containing protein n=1 Tax=uncultured Planktosalinus sp. TaxID=1810935 RepID=UPI0030D83F76